MTAPGLSGTAMTLAGGLALFLFGMGQMAEALKASAGPGFKRILRRLTTNRFTAALTGTLLTAVIQSSSVTTVLVVGFVSAGLMSLTQSIGVILGANVGTTVTAQILAFKVSKYALLLVAAGFAALFAGRSDRVRQYGKLVMGLGLIFFGMSVMGDAMAPLRGSAFFLRSMEAMTRPAAGIAVGALFTALLQSSSVTMGIVIVLASQGFITLEGGIALALGANIGTCVTAQLAAFGRPAEARRAALVHLLFNVTGALAWLAFIDDLARLAVAISPRSYNLAGVELLAAEAPRQIANANTLFNVANTLVALPFAGLIARLVTRIVPDRPSEGWSAVRPKYLDEVLISTPSLALAAVRMELGHMGGIVADMFRDLWAAFSSRRAGHLEEVALHDEAVDMLEEKIVEYLSRVRKASLSDRESDELGRLMAATAFMENIGDVVESELVPLAEEALQENLYGRSETMRQLLRELFNEVLDSVESVTAAVRDGDGKAAREILDRKREINRLAGAILERQSHHLSVSGQRDFRAFRFQTEFLERLRRVYSLSKRIARTVIVPGGEGAKGP